MAHILSDKTQENEDLVMSPVLINSISDARLPVTNRHYSSFFKASYAVEFLPSVFQIIWDKIRDVLKLASLVHCAYSFTRMCVL
jgi:hypothetical protein